MCGEKKKRINTLQSKSAWCASVCACVFFPNFHSCILCMENGLLKTSIPLLQGSLLRFSFYRLTRPRARSDCAYASCDVGDIIILNNQKERGKKRSIYRMWVQTQVKVSHEICDWYGCRCSATDACFFCSIY